MGLIDTIYTENHEIIEWLHLITGYSFEEIAQANEQFAERLNINLAFKNAQKYNDMIDQATIQAIIDKKKKGKNKQGLFNKYEILSKITGKNQSLLRLTADFHKSYDEANVEVSEKHKAEVARVERETKKAAFLQKLKKNR